MNIAEIQQDFSDKLKGREIKVGYKVARVGNVYGMEFDGNVKLSVELVDVETEREYLVNIEEKADRYIYMVMYNYLIIAARIEMAK